MAVSAVNIAQSLGGIDFPCNKQQLIQHARRKGASQEVISILEKLPEREYNNAADVMQAWGQTR